MRRRTFLTSAAAAAATAGAPLAAFGDFAVAARPASQAALFGALRRPRAGEWVRFIMGSGVDYQKQIAVDSEPTETSQLLYVETQIGTPGGSCNPNTLKRVYLQTSHFGSLFAQPAVLANVANSGTTLSRWGDVGDGQTQTPLDARLRLLDTAYLYDERPLRIVSTVPTKLRLPFGTLDTTHVVAEFASPYDARHRLRRIELWSTPAVPYGVAKYRALVDGGQPFEMHVFSHGANYASDLRMSLATVRSITPDGTFTRTS